MKNIRLLIIAMMTMAAGTVFGQPKVYFTKEISPESLVKIYKALGVEANGRVAVKISTGEGGNTHYLKPTLIRNLVEEVNGTVVECGTAYGGTRQDPKKHWETIHEHGFDSIFAVDIMDEFGDIRIPVKDRKHLKYDIVGEHLANYGFMINLAHFKGHAMGGFGGVLKNASIGVASTAGKAYIHSAGKTDKPELTWTKEYIAAGPTQDSFLESMAAAAQAVHNYFKGNIIYINVMNIVTRSMAHDGTKTNINIGAGSYGTVQAEATNQTRCGKLSSSVSAQYNRSDNHRPRMGFEQYGGHLKLGYDLSKHWNTYLDADITHFNSSYPGSVSTPMYSANQWITRGVVSAALRNDYGKTNGELSIYNSFGRHKIDDGTQDPSKPTKRYFRSKDALTGISWFQSAQLFTGNRVTAGIDYQHIYGHAYYTSKETGEIIDTPNKQSGKSHRNEIAAYVGFRQELTTWLTVDAAMRLDHHSVSGTEWIPQAGIVIRPTGNGELKAMASKGFRNPTMREMYLYPPSNEELEPERMWNCELSWRQRISSLSYGMNVFYIKGDNMIQTIERKNVNTGEIENYGLELEADYRIGKHWQLNTNHSLLHMKNIIVATPKYKGFIGADYYCRDLTVNAGLMYIAGLHTSAGNNETKENFCLLNVNATYRLSPVVSLWLRGENLLAQRYEINQGYPMPKATFMGGVNLTF
ncbi:MAG: TonB-dependent receptor [Prevotella sp.]|nr:TonB-dependent receptor [Prevotella sp.]